MGLEPPFSQRDGILLHTKLLDLGCIKLITVYIRVLHIYIYIYIFKYTHVNTVNHGAISPSKLV